MPRARTGSPRRTQKQVNAELRRLAVPERSSAEPGESPAPGHPPQADRATPDDATVRRMIEAAYT
jgi:hypothetical protein